MFQYNAIIKKHDNISLDAAKRRCAHAIYLATYFHPRNTECQSLMNQDSSKFPYVDCLKQFVAET